MGSDVASEKGHEYRNSSGAAQGKASPWAILRVGSPGILARLPAQSFVWRPVAALHLQKNTDDGSD
jgi:hypothetical protein